MRCGMRRRLERTRSLMTVLALSFGVFLACEREPAANSLSSEMARAETTERLRSMIEVLDQDGLSFAPQRKVAPLVTEQLEDTLLEFAHHSLHEARRRQLGDDVVVVWEQIVAALQQGELGAHARGCGRRAKLGEQSAHTCVMLLGELVATARRELQRRLSTAAAESE